MTDPNPTIKPRFLAITTPAAVVIGFVMSTIFWAINPTAVQIAGISHEFDFYGDVYLPLASIIVSLAGVLGAVWPSKAARPLEWWKWVALFVLAGVGACGLWVLSLFAGFWCSLIPAAFHP